MCEKINFNLYLTRGVLKKTWILPTSSIKCLDRLFENRKMFYICRGNQLDKEKEAQVAGLYSNCFVVAIGPEETSQIPFWLKQTSKIDTISDDMLIIPNPDISMEICRVRDLRMMKRDYKMIASKKQYFKTDNQQQQQQIFSLSDPPSINIDYEPLTVPNDQALPVNW